MLAKLSLTVLALAFFLQAAVALPFWGWHAHPEGFPGYNGTVSFPTGTAPTGYPTGFPTGFPHPTGYPVPPMGGHHMMKRDEGFEHIKRFEGARQARAVGFFPYAPTATGYGFPTGTGFPCPTGTGTFPTSKPTGYGW